MTITKEMLTEEFGFTKGVAILINGKAHSFNGFEIGEKYSWIDTLYNYIGTNNIESIKVLSGPLSIWNHAPDWANYVSHSANEICWYSEPPFWWDRKSPKIKPRPWWAKKPNAYESEIQEYDRSKT